MSNPDGLIEERLWRDTNYQSCHTSFINDTANSHTIRFMPADVNQLLYIDKVDNFV